MNIKDLFDQAADHLQVILMEIDSGNLDVKEIQKRVRSLNSIHMDLIDTLSPAFKKLEVIKKDDKLTFSASHVICELSNGASMTREKARERWSPSSEECNNCNQCRV